MVRSVKTWTILGLLAALPAQAQPTNFNPVIAGMNGADFASLPTTVGNLLDSLTTTRGSIIIRGASGWTALVPDTAGYVLTDGGVGADPYWAAGGGGGGTPGGSSGQGQYNNAGAFGGYTVGGDCTADFTTGVFTCTTLNSVSPGAFFSGTDAGNLTGTVSVNRFNSGTGASASTYLRGDGTWVTPTISAVTSVTFTGDGTVLSSTPSAAVTSTGTLTATLNSQSANAFLAGPTTGAAAAPTFRGIDIADLPVGTSSTTVAAGDDSRFTTNAASGLSVPYYGIPASADPDIYDIPFTATIAASTDVSATCKVLPVLATTVVVRLWTKGAPATNSTLCTGTLSTACAWTSPCTIGSTTVSSNPSPTTRQALSIEATQIASDSAARVSFSIGFSK